MSVEVRGGIVFVDGVELDVDQLQPAEAAAVRRLAEVHALMAGASEPAAVASLLRVAADVGDSLDGERTKQ